MKDVVYNTVQEVRKKQGMTQEQLARSLGVSRQTISALEKGNYTPSVALALKIAQTFDLSIHDIFELK